MVGEGAMNWPGEGREGEQSEEEMFSQRCAAYPRQVLSEREQERSGCRRHSVLFDRLWGSG
jgi:hypothetical protein